MMHMPPDSVQNLICATDHVVHLLYLTGSSFMAVIVKVERSGVRADIHG